MTHICHAEGCTKAVPPRMFACLRHWKMVPPELQRELWANYRRGQERDKKVTPMYLLVQSRCRLAIAEAEGLTAAADRVRKQIVELLLPHMTEADVKEAIVADPRVAVRILDQRWFGA